MERMGATTVHAKNSTMVCRDLKSSLTCGTLSPVKHASLATARPRSKRRSAGTGTPHAPPPAPAPPAATPPPPPIPPLPPPPSPARIEMTSPGSSASVPRAPHHPSRNASTVWPEVFMPRSVRILCWRCRAVVASKARIMPKVNRVYLGRGRGGAQGDGHRGRTRRGGIPGAMPRRVGGGRGKAGIGGVIPSLHAPREPPTDRCMRHGLPTHHPHLMGATAPVPLPYIPKQRALPLTCRSTSRTRMSRSP